jgi:ubiquinone/menaquinone biosynthesis C-methylase UbiE
MKKNRLFDRAAENYDQTRPALEPIATHGTQAILDQVRLDARILDVGAGTGRISIPLLERGLDVFGSDLSPKMLSRFLEKMPSARVVLADAARLPFPTGHFDAVLTVHVLHLVSRWQDALDEIKRVLKPGGVYLNIRTWESVGVSNRDRVREYWSHWIAERGYDGRHPGAQDRQEVNAELISMGARIEEIDVVYYTFSTNMTDELKRFTDRVYSNTWEIPDQVYDESLATLRAWMEVEFGDLDQQFEDQLHYVIDVAHFDE